MKFYFWILIFVAGIFLIPVICCLVVALSPLAFVYFVIDRFFEFFEKKNKYWVEKKKTDFLTPFMDLANGKKE